MINKLKIKSEFGENILTLMTGDHSGAGNPYRHKSQSYSNLCARGFRCVRAICGSRLWLFVSPQTSEERRFGGQQEANLPDIHRGRASGTHQEAQKASAAKTANGCASRTQSKVVDGLCF